MLAYEDEFNNKKEAKDRAAIVDSIDKSLQKPRNSAKLRSKSDVVVVFIPEGEVKC